MFDISVTTIILYLIFYLMKIYIFTEITWQIIEYRKKKKLKRLYYLDSLWFNFLIYAVLLIPGTIIVEIIINIYCRRTCYRKHKKRGRK